MNTCAVQNVATLRAADHICIWDKSRWPFRYTHHGVVFEEGASEEDIVIAHVWSSEPGFRASQMDSSFRLTSLAEFLNGRPVRDMRRVEYNSSLLGNALSKLGEVHRSRSDPPPIVLARCRFLLGLGQGHFSIVTLNCEHVALWCKTGVLWSKQLFQKSYEHTPYVPEKNSEHVVAPLKATLAILKGEVRQRNNRLLALKGRRVYLRVGDTKFVKRLGDGKLYLVHNDPKERDMAFRHVPTSFVLNVDIEAYNCVTVMFRVANASGSVSDSMISSLIAGSSSSVGRSASSCSVVTASRSNLSVRTSSEADEEEYQDRQSQLVETRPRAVTNSAQTRDRLNQRFEYIYSGGNSVKLVARRSYHRESLFRFEYSWDGELQSRRNRRWYVGAQTRDGLLRTFNSRDHATRFEIVDADLVDSESVEIDFRAVNASAKTAVPTEDEVTPSNEVVPPANTNVDVNLIKANEGGETTDQQEISGDADSKRAPSEA